VIFLILAATTTALFSAFDTQLSSTYKNYFSSTKATSNPHRTAVKRHDDHGIFDGTPSSLQASTWAINHLSALLYLPCQS